MTETLPTDFTFVSSANTQPGDGRTLTISQPQGECSSVADSAGNPHLHGDRSIGGHLRQAHLTPDRVRRDRRSRVTVRTAVPSSSGGGGGGGGVTPANRAPVFSEGASAARSVAENSAAGTAVGRRVTATDPDGNRVTYSLGGDDASLFAIDPRTGQISVGEGTALDFETKSSYAVTARAADRRNSSDTIALTITVTNVGLDDSYDANDDGMIDGDEVLDAVEDYFNDVSGIDSERILDIVELYFSS